MFELIRKKRFGFIFIALYRFIKNKRTPFALLIIFGSIYHSQIFAGTAQMNGVAVVEKFGKPHYYVGLFTRTFVDQADDLQLTPGDRVEIRIADDSFSIRNFRRHWREGVALNSTTDEIQKHSKDFNTLMAMLNLKIQPGDRLTLSIHKETLRFTFNKVVIGKLESKHIFKILLRHWVGKFPISKSIRAGLMTKGKPNPNIEKQFKMIQPSELRVSAKPEANKKHVDNIDEHLKNSFSLAESKRKEIAAIRKADTPPTILLNDYLPENASASEKAYIIKLRKWAQKLAFYPRHMFKKNKEALVVLEVGLGTHGGATKITTLKNTGDEVFDNISRRVTRASYPYPEIPDNIPTDQYGHYIFTMPFEYKIP